MRFFFHFKNLAIDCTWEEWGEWSACPDECGISRVFRTREKNEHICGGVACTGKSREKKNCDRFADLKMENDVCQQNFFNSTEEIERLKKKLCQNVLCRNGGTCQEGDCICPDGFNGRTCAESKYEDDMWDTGKDTMWSHINLSPKFDFYQSCSIHIRYCKRRHYLQNRQLSRVVV